LISGIESGQDKRFLDYKGKGLAVMRSSNLVFYGAQPIGKGFYKIQFSEVQCDVEEKKALCQSLIGAITSAISADKDNGVDYKKSGAQWIR